MEINIHQVTEIKIKKNKLSNLDYYEITFEAEDEQITINAFTKTDRKIVYSFEESD